MYGTTVTSAGSTALVGICRLSFIEIILLSESNCLTFHSSHLNTHISLLSTLRKLVHFWTLMHHLSESSEIRILDSFSWSATYPLLAPQGHRFGSLCFRFPICKVGYYLASLGTVKETTQHHDEKRVFQHIWGLMDLVYLISAPPLPSILNCCHEYSISISNWRLFSQWYR